MSELKLTVKDANKDAYPLTFKTKNTLHGIELTCPLCGETLFIRDHDVGCASGHIAYVIIDPVVLEIVEDNQNKWYNPSTEVTG